MSIDKQMAVRLAKVCQWVYDFAPSKESALLEYQRKLKKPVVKIKDRKKVPTSFAGVMEYSDVIVVAFQGTITEFGLDGNFRLDSLTDWIQNFRLEQLPASKTKLPGLVHEGFFKQLRLISKHVADALPRQGNKPIVLTGHSQGGAVATLATKLLKDQGFPIRETYTFAAPRSGDAAFCRSVSALIHRIEFGDDIVPHVPPTLAQGSSLSRAFSVLARFGLPGVLSSFYSLLKRMSKQSYVGAGKLTYRAEDGALMTDIPAAEEKKLFTQRRKGLIFARKDLVAHHHLPHYMNMFS
jgi:hypothetical protein